MSRLKNNKLHEKVIYSKKSLLEKFHQLYNFSPLPKINLWKKKQKT